nr:carboxy terminal-processing peptidase [Gaetbulibacter sp. 4G1]
MLKKYLLLLYFLLGLKVIAQNQKFCEQITQLKAVVKTSHYAPKPINDSLSKEVHKLFVNNLDKNKRFFTLSDIKTFKKDIYKLDDYLNLNSCEFINIYIDKLKQRVNLSKSYISELTDKTLNYSGVDTLYYDADLGYKYFEDTDDAKKYWSKKVRYSIITKLIENDSVLDNLKKNFTVLERQIKPQIIQNELCLLDELINQSGGIDQFVKESFFNAFLNYQDPHSIYFNSSNKVQFENLVANSQLSFGITTTKNEKGDIVISYIAPGSPAFKNINIEVNDIIKSLKYNDNTLETYCVSNEDVIAYLNDDNKQKIIFKIKKSNGLVLDVELTKKTVEIEANSVRGYLIKNNKTIGYIKIPSFYTDLESPNGLGMANDFAKEIYKLKKENIQGLIIDLRFNGGGSMKEASDLSGMFIDRGPTSIIKYNNGEIHTIKDFKRGTIFSKPVVVLINAFSASASELFASVMQDYNRAIIVGATTHGKSSAQVIFPLDENKDLGFAKLTIEKFYRPTGKSLQSKGVIPDVIIPTIYDDFETQERYEKFALQNDSIKPNIRHIPSKKPNINKLKLLSSNRINANNDFKNISRMNKELIKSYINKKDQYPLTIDNVYHDIDNYKKLWEWYKNVTNKDSEQLKFVNTTSTNKIIQFDSSAIDDNKTVLSDLTKDIILNETHAIIIDLINSKTTN